MNRSDAGETPSLGKAVKKGAAWTLTGRALIFFVDIGASVLLARLLDPKDFGIFGIALIFTGLASRFGNIGFGLALIQRREINDDHVSSLFVINLLIFPTLTGLLILASPFVGAAFGNPLVGSVLVLVALEFLTTPFTSVSRAVMQRRMDFRGPTTALISDHFVAALTSVALALAGWGVWSLVYGKLAGGASSSLVLFVMSGWRPRLHFRRAAMRDLYSFGLKMFLKNLLVYSSEKVDFFIIGRQLGPTSLGLYEKAFGLMDLAVKELSRKISMVLFSAFSKLQDDPAKFRTAYMKVILTLSLVCFPFFFGLFLVAPSFIHFLFGEKWLASVVPLQILCVAGLLRMHLQISSTIINSMGKVAPEVWRRGVAFILLAVGCWVGGAWGIVGVTTAVTITTGILMLTMTSYLRMLIGMTWIDFMRPQRPAFVASLCMSGVVLIYQQWAESVFGAYSAVTLFSATAVGVIAYAMVLWVLRPAMVVMLLKEFMADFGPSNRLTGKDRRNATQDAHDKDPHQLSRV